MSGKSLPGQVAIALLVSGCSKLLGISDPSTGDDDGGRKDAGPDGEIDSSIDAPPPCTNSTAFGAEMSFDVGAIGTALVVGELDRASGLDVVIAVGSGVQIMKGNGAGGFAVGMKIVTTATGVAIGDFDLSVSVDDDLVVWQVGSNTIAAIRQDSTVVPSTFLPEQPLTGPFGNVKFAAVGQFDGGFNADLLVHDDVSGTRVFTSNLGTPGTFARGGVIPGAGAADELVLIDNIDGASRDDAVFVNQGTVKVSYNNAGFATPVTIGTGAQGPRAIGFGKFTGDATLDLIVATPAGGKLFRQDPAMPGKFDPVPGTIPEVTGNTLQVLDVNGDGTDDIVVANRIILQCPGTAAGAVGTFTQVEGFNAIAPSVLVDVNKNMKPDLLRLEGTTLKVRIQ